MAKTHYETLGVDKKATQDEIKSAYRKLARQYHPDLHPGDEECARKFKEINEANEILSDPQKRQQYDYELENPGRSAGFGGFGGGDFGGGFSDIFDIFNQFTGGGSARRQDTSGEDITLEVELSFLDAAKGCKKEVTYNRKEPCAACRSTGAKNGTAYRVCDKCKGNGVIQYRSGNGFFQTVQTRVCDACGGKGKTIIEKCEACGGRGYQKKSTTVSFNIPAGADNGSYIKKRGFGEASTMGGEAGDLNVVFKVAPHKIFTRKNFDLYVDLPIDFKTAALGGKVKVPTLDSVTTIDIPEGTQSGKVFTVRGKGISSRMGSGNLYVTVYVEVPSKLTKAQKQRLMDFDSDMEVKQYDKMKKYSDNLQSLYGEKPYTDK
ncbi:MAG: molecular chaperone DnaJ [Clostridia bacterium]|nr:molecular chaperone DnaJ [Clostridia bacterium]